VERQKNLREVVTVKCSFVGRRFAPFGKVQLHELVLGKCCYNCFSIVYSTKFQVTNERLKIAFEQFGSVERAVVVKVYFPFG
jgi:hypothetical protein